MASDESWKDKYFRELEESEHKEKQWQTERHLLERMLVRTSLASEGQSDELDGLLGRVREDLRQKKLDVESWRELQDEIDRQITLLDESHERARRAAPSVAAPELAKEAPAEEELELADRTQQLRIARRVGQLLGQMLQQVSLESQVEARARGLQKMLLGSNDWTVLRKGWIRWPIWSLKRLPAASANSRRFLSAWTSAWRPCASTSPSRAVCTSRVRGIRKP
ncbi:diguanylate cyclase [Marinobacter persicus]|uniref:Diguanylate cyclase n=1 Tax=Marinobacter persicus TaxID=930118 RepID=A0A1I3T3P6_9GAMM|nr:hypothetical protein [Marinobacter persicus]GHD40459.1 hypothetical protein GCM10008110_01390 [Marinobacter persicus]SFJ65132.1 diguanylate cyclase [Marinobacter persicus]